MKLASFEQGSSTPSSPQFLPEFPGDVHIYGALRTLLELPSNWDSYGAVRVRHDDAYRMADLLAAIMHPATPLPSIVPTSRGGIQVEWHSEGIDFEVVTLPDDRFGVYFNDEAQNEEWELETRNDWGVINGIIRKLTEKSEKRRGPRRQGKWGT